MKEIIVYLLPLAVVVLLNIASGTYYNVQVQDIKFDKWKLLNGALKALIVGVCFIGLAYVFDTVDLGSLNPNPKMIMVAAITLYAGKSIANLAKILGVNTTAITNVIVKNKDKIIEDNMNK